jgi:flagellar biosynthesis/type III secretory pathway protein FliH
MSVYRLETFAPGFAGPSAAALASRPDPVERRLAAAREAAYAEGFVAGQATATEAMLAEEGRLTSELVEALADARMTNDAARRHVAASLVPMLEAIVAAVTPALAEAGLAAEVTRAVERAIAAAPKVRPRLRCAPEVVDRLGDRLEERGVAAVIEAAPELLPREAQLFWDQGFDHIDLDACADQVRTCVLTHLDNAGSSNGEHDEQQD